MTLDELIEELSNRDPSKEVENGFGEGGSYRGYYHDAAFEPVLVTTFGEMLKYAESLLNTVQYGYNGGEYKIDGFSDVYIAGYGQIGEPINNFNFKYWDNQ